MTSLFSTSFMCRRCGREVCNECFLIVKELTKPESLTRGRRKSREKYARSNSSLLSCSKRKRPARLYRLHASDPIRPVGAERAVEEMQCILDNAERLRWEWRRHLEATRCYERSTVYTVSGPYNHPIYDDFTPPNTPSHVTSIPIHRAQIIPASFYDPSSSNEPPKAEWLRFSLCGREGYLSSSRMSYLGLD
jgi:lysine-specific demethylase 3